MKCKECDCCIKGWFEWKPNDYVCIGVLEPFVIKDINVECTEYPELRNKTISIGMSNMSEFKEFKISNHASQRYAERIMGRDNTADINRFIIENEEKIKTDINKLIHYGETIFSGKQSKKDNKGNVVDVILKDCWVILADTKDKVVVTLFKIDLGLDDEFNKAYISKMVEKLNGRKEVLETTKKQVESESNMYKEMISDAESQIKEYKTMIKNLEELCEAYKTIVDNNNVRIAQANKDVIDIVNTLINKKEF